jgi:hypothetical protein
MPLLLSALARRFLRCFCRRFRRLQRRHSAYRRRLLLLLLRIIIVTARHR